MDNARIVIFLSFLSFNVSAQTWLTDNTNGAPPYLVPVINFTAFTVDTCTAALNHGYEQLGFGWQYFGISKGSDRCNYSSKYLMTAGGGYTTVGGGGYRQFGTMDCDFPMYTGDYEYLPSTCGSPKSCIDMKTLIPSGLQFGLTTLGNPPAPYCYGAPNGDQCDVTSSSTQILNTDNTVAGTNVSASITGTSSDVLCTSDLNGMALNAPVTPDTGGSTGGSTDPAPDPDPEPDPEPDPDPDGGGSGDSGGLPDGSGGGTVDPVTDPLPVDETIPDSIPDAPTTPDTTSTPTDNGSVGGNGGKTDCSEEYSCSGDAINCQILYELWLDRCGLDQGFDLLNEHLNSRAQSDADFINGEEISFENVIDNRSEWGASSCPEPKQFTVAGTNQQLSYGPFCSFATSVNPFVIVAALLFSIKIIGRGVS